MLAPNLAVALVTVRVTSACSSFTPPTGEVAVGAVTFSVDPSAAAAASAASAELAWGEVGAEGLLLHAAIAIAHTPAQKPTSFNFILEFSEKVVTAQSRLPSAEMIHRSGAVGSGKTADFSRASRNSPRYVLSAS